MLWMLWLDFLDDEREWTDGSGVDSPKGVTRSVLLADVTTATDECVAADADPEEKQTILNKPKYISGRWTNWFKCSATNLKL